MSLRYSIYKVQTRSFRSFLTAANFYILAHLVELVKNFFQVFSNSFCARCAPGKPFITQLLYLIILISICQELFSCFSKFSDLSLPSGARLAYTSTPYPNCQALFYNFFYSFLVYLTKKHLSLHTGLPGLFRAFLSLSEIEYPSYVMFTPPEPSFRGGYYII